ncbi:hypothetical protein GOV04_03950 [Candidatus Woesearchaeota archaeon]|nr:hypothetical protein [Candidatus Woesearchaeota archaeon]
MIKKITGGFKKVFSKGANVIKAVGKTAFGDAKKAAPKVARATKSEAKKLAGVAKTAAKKKPVKKRKSAKRKTTRKK